MNNNIERFSIYSGKILEILSSKFPVPYHLKDSEVISEFLKFDKHDELKEKGYAIDVAEMVIAMEAHNDDEVAFARKKKAELEQCVDDIKDEERRDYASQASVFQGTLTFLIAEDLIREADDGGYQLTSKSFLHLNKNFENGRLSDSDTPLCRLKGIFYSGADVSKKVAVDTAINVISSALV